MSARGATVQAIHPVLAARDIGASIRSCRRLGFALSRQDDGPALAYAVLRRHGVELHQQRADAGQWAEGIDRPACRFQVDDLDALHAQFMAAAALDATSSDGSPSVAPTDTPRDTREFQRRDPGGNSLQFYRLR